MRKSLLLFVLALAGPLAQAEPAPDPAWQNAIVFRESPAASPAAFPARPVRFVVGFTPGGPSDILARALGQKLAGRWGRQVLIENRPGAGGNLAAEAVAKSAPDGHTWLLGNNSILATNQSLYRSLPYDPVRDFAPVALVAIQPNILVVHPGLPAASVPELVSYLKNHPGKVNYASSGSGAAAHLAGELFKAMTGVDIVHVPYKGSTGARNDILGGQIQMLFDSVPTMAPMIKSGLVRAIATSGKTRSAILPEVPTLDEAGAKGFQATLWTGFMAPAATPQPIVDLLNREISKAVSQPEIKKKWQAEGANPITMTQAEYAAFIQAQVDKWAKVIKTNNIAPIN